MAKKSNSSNQSLNMDNLIGRLTNKIENSLEDKEDSIANIIDFCERSDLLDIKGQGFELWPWQRIVLKCFYRGSLGNENLELTAEEIELMNEHKQLIALQKYFSTDEEKKPTPMRELVLVLGRRSFKTFLISIATTYEVYKLREIHGGDPHSYFKIPYDKEISIINCAVSKEQAKSPLFDEIKTRLRNSPYFQKAGVLGKATEDTIHIFTPKDTQRQLKLIEQDNPVQLTGSIVLRCGHSNSASLRGKLAIAVIFDELAHFVTSSGKSSGSQVYESMTPSVKTFKEHGRIMSISNPAGKDGIFYKLYKSGKDKNVRYTTCFKLPTWVANHLLDRSEFDDDFRRNPLSAEMEYGAEFAGSAASLFVGPEEVDSITDLTLSQQMTGTSGRAYFMHIDPALSSHVYGAIIGHVEEFTHTSGEVRRKFVVDHIERWVPEAGTPLNLDKIDDEIITLSRKFPLAALTFDNFQSAHSRQRFLKYGINAKETRFGQAYKDAIYAVLKEAIKMQNVSIPGDYFLVNELKGLRVKFTARGRSIYPDPDGEVPSDDLTDCLAGAMFIAFNFGRGKDKRLPRSRVAFTGPR